MSDSSYGKRSLPRPIIPYLLSLHNDYSMSTEYSSKVFAPPDPHTPTVLTPIVKKAKEYIEIALPPWARNHCYRVYAFGAVLVQRFGWKNESWDSRDKLGWDEELFFLAAILHDLGWIPASECRQPECKLSFEIWGGIKARELLIEWGAPKDTADQVCEAIIRHTEGYQIGNVKLIHALLSLGAFHDLHAILHEPGIISPDTTRAICEMYPRLGMAQQLNSFVSAELGNKPGCLAQTWTVAFADQGFDIVNGPKYYRDLDDCNVEDALEKEKEWLKNREGMKWELK